MDNSELMVGRDVAGRFLPGQSGNPAGKRKGTRNRATLLEEMLGEGEAAALARIVIDRALAGDPVAARFCLDRLSPRPRGRAIRLDLPEEGADIVAAFDATLQALAEGEITPEEAATVARFLDGRRSALQAVALERKLRQYDEEEIFEGETEEEESEEANPGSSPCGYVLRQAQDEACSAAGAGCRPEEERCSEDENCAESSVTPRPEPPRSGEPKDIGPAPCAPHAPHQTTTAQDPALHSACISPSPGTIRGMISVLPGAERRALAALLAQRRRGQLPGAAP